MRRVISLAGFVAAVTALAALAAGAAGARTPSPHDPRLRADDLPSRLGDKQHALETTALELQAKGAIARGAKVGKVAKGQYVELRREGQDSIWTVLGEFGDVAHNSIPEPDRSKDNTTIWAPDFSRDYYRTLLFDQSPGANSMANFYAEQSSGRYSVDGDVTDWVTVPRPAAYYGTNDKPDSAAWDFVRDEVDAWYASQKAAGKTDAEIADYLSRFDRWDRYDYDGDGDFDEPDGYVDHFQAIHAGQGEEAGGGSLGTDAIWSHRWYAWQAANGPDGPGPHGFGGLRIGDTNLWIGDYTIEPENGGVGVFSHEFGHDLGLPDEYDTSGNSGGAENSTGFWTLMSSGSWGSTGEAADGIGDQPFHMNAWDKWYLGWLDYAVVFPGDRKTSIRLGPAETNTKQTQGAIVVLPDKQVTKNVGTPYAGEKFYYSGAANDLDATMTRTVTVPADAASLTAKVRYNIETGYDYAYLEVDGAAVPTSVSSSPVLPEGIDGVSDGWVDLTADLSQWAGKTVTLGFGYKTDGGVQGQTRRQPAGFAIDDVAIGDSVDGAEADAGWTYDSNLDGTGFHATSGTESFSYFNAYVAENRQYLGADADLKTGPYNFTTDVWAERFPYQDGMLVWYYDSSYANNNVGDHPGEGEILPVDAHPAIEHWNDGQVMRGRFQAYDATFGLHPTDAITLHSASGATTIASKPAVPVFDDTASWWVGSDPGDALGHYQAGWLSVKTPHTGTQIRVKSVTPGGFMQIDVTPPQE
ncbi:MAG TPA: immune inhibitor A domain-containing protein [Gaiellaceae bacterium]|nr:immune inhibitor A domain-containing protein [Gaiellaceae bacterium]